MACIYDRDTTKDLLKRCSRTHFIFWKYKKSRLILKEVIESRTFYKTFINTE